MGFPGAATADHGLCKPATPPVRWCKRAKHVPLRPVRLESSGDPGFGKDIDHSHHAFEIEYDGGKMDGFDLIGFGENPGGPPAKLYPYQYVARSETKAYWDLARRYALADEMFSTDTASSFIAHQELIAGTVRLNGRESLTDEPDGFPWGCDASLGTQTPVLLRDGVELQPGAHTHLPFPCFTQYGTMADLLDNAGVSWQYYVNYMFGLKAEFSGLVWNAYDAIKKVRYGSDWSSHISNPNTQIFRDVRDGRLPAVAWVIPSLYDSDHPSSGCNGGPWWVTRVVNAIGKSRYWNDTAIVILWDDWGGWYDNVPPAQIGYTSLGFRVPMIVVSPYARHGYVSHTRYDIGSILKFVEETFNLGSLGTTDATASSMQDVFDFSQRPSTFSPASLPPVESCARRDLRTGPSAKAIVAHARGIPD